MESNFKKIARDSIQPKEFCFNKVNLKKAMILVKMYPSNYKESSIMPLLSLAQNQSGGWLPKKAFLF